MVVWAAAAFLSYYWLGAYGIALTACGIALLIPNYLGINTYFALF